MKYRVNPFLSWALSSAFLLAVISGILLAYPFHEKAPFVSTVGIDTVVPYGWFLRRLHYFSSWGTLILLLWHAGEALWARAEERRRPLPWLALSLSLPLIFLAAFTGYVIRWDETGKLAGFIAESLSLKLPVIGPYLNALLFTVREGGIHRPYLFHFWASLVLLGLYGIWHFRARRWPAEPFLLVFAVCGALALFLPVGLHAPGPHLLVKGPWFFVGVQEALRHGPPFLAGILLPSLGPTFYFLVRVPSLRRLSLFGLILWSAGYGMLTLWGLLR